MKLELSDLLSKALDWMQSDNEQETTLPVPELELIDVLDIFSTEDLTWFNDV